MQVPKVVDAGLEAKLEKLSQRLDAVLRLQNTRTLTVAEEREVGLLRREMGRVGEEVQAKAEAEMQRARIEAEWRPNGVVSVPSESGFQWSIMARVSDTVRASGAGIRGGAVCSDQTASEHHESARAWAAHKTVREPIGTVSCSASEGRELQCE